jgi:hypothetical protein
LKILADCGKSMGGFEIAAIDTVPYEKRGAGWPSYGKPPESESNWSRSW